MTLHPKRILLAGTALAVGGAGIAYLVLERSWRPRGTKQSDPASRLPPESRSDSIRAVTPADLGLSEGDWRYLAEGKVLLDEDEGEGLVAIEARFLVSAPPSLLMDVLTDPALIYELYPDVVRFEVRERGEDFSIDYFEGRYSLFHVWKVLRRDNLPGDGGMRWHMVEGNLDAYEGSYLFTATPDPERTLVTFSNRIEAGSLIPDSVVRYFGAARIPEFADRLRAITLRKTEIKTKE